MNLAVIPARGGSKRIPRKNIKLFHGKPIIAYSIEVAIKSNLFDHVIVSTDDDEIASIAIEAGAEVPFIRPNTLADDYTGTNDVAKHALQWFLDDGKEFEYACCIYATAPLLQEKYLQQGFKQLQENDNDFAFSVTHFEFPIQRAVRITKNNKIEAIYPEFNHTRSQDLEEAFHDAGQFYWGKASSFLNDSPMLNSTSAPVLIPASQVQDIDTAEDWKRAELIYKSLNRATE